MGCMMTILQIFAHYSEAFRFTCPLILGGDDARVSQAKTEGRVHFAWVPTQIEGDGPRVSQAKTEGLVDFAGYSRGPVWYGF